MKSRANILSRALCSTAICCVIAVAAHGQGEPKQPKLTVPIPVHQKASGVRIPYFDDDGKLRMRFTIDEMLRTDLDHIQMTNTRVETFDDDGNHDMTLLLPLSSLDLNTRVIKSDRQFVLQRTDFELMGDTLELDTAKQKGKVTGAVKMVIYNFEDVANKEPGK